MIHELRTLRVFGLLASTALLFHAAPCAAAGPTDQPPAGPPAAQRGFQLALRTGFALPLGDVSATTKMSDAVGFQIPLILDIGVKPISQLFLGAYFGIAQGAAAGQVADVCSQLNVNCSGISLRFGLQAQYNLRPAETVNPWFGYGIGYEIAGSSGEKGKNSVTNTLAGLEFAHFLAGVDFRLSHVFGIGPFLDFALGQYSTAETKQDAGGRVTTLGGSISAKGLHEWLVFGARGVFFP